MINIPDYRDDFNKISFPNVILEPFTADSHQSCMLFVALRFAGVESGRLITVDDAHQVYQRYVPDLHEQWARRALSHPLFHSDERVMTRKRGKPARLYRMPSDETLAAYYGVSLQGTSYTTIPENVIGHRPRFTMAVHEALVLRRPGQYSRKWLADRLGISESTLRAWEKRYSRVIAHPVLKEVLRITRENIAKLIRFIPEKAEAGAKWLSVRFPSKKGNGKELYKRRMNRHNVREAINFFKEAVVVQQECNYYRMRTENDYMMIERQWVAMEPAQLLRVPTGLVPLGYVPRDAFPLGYVPT